MEDWPSAVRAAIQRLVKDRPDKIFTRQEFLRLELPTVERETGTTGITTGQTLSRTLQDLRDSGELKFLEPGRYKSLLRSVPALIDIEEVDLDEAALADAIRRGALQFGRVETSTEIGMARRRRGQRKLRDLTLLNYGTRCALCEIDEPGLLVASHIVPWAEALLSRGRLDNVICLCRLHDALFEAGLWGLSDDYTLLLSARIRWPIINAVLPALTSFRAPESHRPSPEFLQSHRLRNGL